MFGSISPYKQLQSPKADNKKPIEEIRRIRSGLSTSPRGLTSPSKQGKKIEETGPVHIEVTQDDHSDRPRFPIRIPVEQMKPKRDYLAQVRKSDTTLDSRPSTAKQVKTEVYTKSGPRRTSETAKGKSPKDVKSLNKRNSMSRTEKPKQAGNLGNTAVDAQDLKKIIENIVDYKFRTYAGASNRALETQKSTSNLSMDMSMRKRPNSSRRPMSSRASNKKSKNTASMHRAASSKKEVKETEYSRMSQPPEPLDPEEAKKEKHERMKKIVIENLKKFSNQQKEKEQKKAEEDQGKTLKKEALKRMNERIKMKNEISPPNPTANIQKSLSPVKHKYEWGADQKRLEMKPERKQSAKKWEKKDPEVRRQEIGLSHLNNLEDIALKKAKIESKEKAEKIMKEAEEKYKLTRKEKTTEEKEKLKLLIHEQIEKKKKEKLDEKAKALREKELKKKRLEALFKDVAEIQAKDLAEKKEAEKNKPKKPIKKKSKKTSEIGGSTNSLPDEDIAANVNRGRGKRPSEMEAEEEYEEEIVEEEGNDEVRELNEDDLYLLDELFEKLDIRMEEELVKGGFKKLKAYCFSEQMNRKVAQEKAAIQQKQKQQQQQLEKQQQLQLKQQQQQQQQSQTQQAGKGKVSFTATSSGQKEKIVEPEKMSSQKQRLVESEKKQQKSFAPANDFDVEDNEEEEQEVYISKPLKESNNYSQGLPPKQSIVEKGKQRSDTSGKKMDFRDDKDEGTGYRIYNQKSADKYKNQMMKENTRKDDGMKIPEGVDFDEMLFNLSSEELIKLPYFSIVK